jgi:ABC-type nitrate/sulfonate/bicarbonate transport system substrate-binding protein
MKYSFHNLCTENPREYQRLLSKEYRKTHPDFVKKTNLQSLQWKRNHPEETKELVKKYRERHPEKVREFVRIGENRRYHEFPEVSRNFGRVQAYNIYHHLPQPKIHFEVWDENLVRIARESNGRFISWKEVA